MVHRRDHRSVPALGRCVLPMPFGMLRMLLATLMMLLAIALALPAAAAEGTSNLPPRPDPPPPYLPPTPAPSPAQRHSAGAYVRLIVAPGTPGEAAPAAIWTVVQWEDEAGAWHDVDGWCGHLDDARVGTKTWWVSAADYGRGPFRWVVLEDQDGPMQAASAPFDLPSGTGRVLDVGVMLP